jgi:pimeloyl-ACP methyl ester carboxylesterase
MNGKVISALFGLLPIAIGTPTPQDAAVTTSRTTTATAATTYASITASPSNIPLVGKPSNDWTCTSAHNPVIMLHGLSLNYQILLSQLQWQLNALGFCTYSFTYGAHVLFPSVGGVRSMLDTAADIADFVREVHAKTGTAQKIDIVGHSEGGVQALLVPLTQSGIAELLGHTVSLGPAVHGAQYYGLTDLAYEGGNITRALVAVVLDLIGCPACDDMATGSAVYNVFLAAAGAIVQDGVKATVVMLRNDTLVTPDVSEVDEPGVRNVFVQDYCPDDSVGHAGLAIDVSVWGIVLNELQENYDGTVFCGQGIGV